MYRAVAAPTLAAARARIDAVQPSDYARTRNALDGAVRHLSPYITHGFVSLAEVVSGVVARHEIDVQHKFIYELGWRAYFCHVWHHHGDDIFRSLHEGPLPDDAYLRELPADIRQANTGVPVVDEAVRTLFATGALHNHARMWLASYVVHVRKVHWRVAADWLYGHLIDGDLASNHLSWQWVAGTGSHKPYLFNAESVARLAPSTWHSPGSEIDTSYEALARMAHEPARPRGAQAVSASLAEPPLSARPPASLGFTAPDARTVAGRDVWIVHPWSLGPLPPALPADTRVVGVCVSDFHHDWPWCQRRWDFVGRRMAELVAERWYGDAGAIGAALKGARRVGSVGEPHIARWLTQWAECGAPPVLFPTVDKRCDSFSQWWTRTSRGLGTAAELLAVHRAPA